MQGPCRWGILGTAGIARKNWHAIRNSGNGVVTAVGSRSAARSAEFIAECQGQVPFPQAPAACGTYDELLSRPDVDAVYIPLPTGLRKEWVLKAAQAGKHVLVEKPVGVTAADVREMLAACDQHNVQFMDGVMYMHSRRMDGLRQVLEDGVSIGRVRRITSNFSFNAPADFLTGNIRVSSDLEPAGCLGDLGWYTIRFALWTMKYQMPTSVSARMLAEAKRPDSPLPVPLEFTAELTFPNGVTAHFYNSFQTEHQQWVSVSGTKGNLLVRDFVLPYYGDEVKFTVTNSVFAVDNCLFNMEEHTRTVAAAEYSNNHPTAQETNLFRKFSELVLSGRRDPHWGEIALKTQTVLDACLKSAHDNGTTITL